ncbi:hypothetical protein [Candidatus Amarolinea dominans]|uniref:hypothetical protein n=1 Tax=Candidatus Amarolinea dominans TaxID=3140696 RepID=UPI0031356588|nr:hypothetical protein [Anaerolineae bacterium]
MNTRRLLALTLIVGLLASTAAAAPLAGPCVPGAAYDPACDANQDGHITITDIQLAAGHWNQNGAFVSDSNHTHLGQTWTGSNNPLTIQGAFGAPSYAVMTLNNSVGHGLAINSVAIDGIYVGSAGYYGMVVNHSGQDGVYVGTAGNPSSNPASAASNGFEVAGAQGDGLYVGRADRNGVYVVSAGQGVVVDSTVYDGMNIYSAGDDGVSVGFTGDIGVYVNQAGTTGVYANSAQASGEWGFYTPDKIHGSNVLLESVSLVAQVSGAESLTAGDLVMAAGIADPLPGSTVHLPQVKRAASAPGGVIGVVEGRLALTSRPRPASALGESAAQAPELHRAEGPAQPGDYVALTVAGAARVKVSAADGPVTVGQRLTAADLAGHARALRTRTLEGMIVSEGAPVIGTALEPLAAGEGLIWVLVNVQ